MAFLERGSNVPLEEEIGCRCVRQMPFYEIAQNGGILKIIKSVFHILK